VTPVLRAKVADNFIVECGGKQYTFTERELMETDLPLAVFIQRRIQEMAQAEEEGHVVEVTPAAPSAQETGVLPGFDAASFNMFYRFQADAEENLGLLHEVEYLLSGCLHWPQYDEPYKLGPKPDLEAFGECLRHLKGAHAALKRLEASCEGRCPAEYDGLRCERRNHHEGNHETHRGELRHVWSCIFYCNPEKQG
jgi:hypothetical protein